MSIMTNGNAEKKIQGRAGRGENDCTHTHTHTTNLTTKRGLVSWEKKTDVENDLLELHFLVVLQQKREENNLLELHFVVLQHKRGRITYWECIL